MALPMNGSNLFQKIGHRKFYCRNRPTKKMWVAMVSTKRNTEEQFGNLREAKIEVFEANRSIVFSYISDSWVDRMIIYCYEIQETTTLSEVKIVLKGIKDQIEITFGSSLGKDSFVDAIMLPSCDSNSWKSQSESIGELA